MKANRHALANDERGALDIAGIIQIMLALVFAAILVVVVATQSDVASANASVGKVTGGKDLVLLLPFIFLGIVIVGLARKAFE